MIIVLQSRNNSYIEASNPSFGYFLETHLACIFAKFKNYHHFKKNTLNLKVLYLQFNSKKLDRSDILFHFCCKLFAVSKIMLSRRGRFYCIDFLRVGKIFDYLCNRTFFLKIVFNESFKFLKNCPYDSHEIFTVILHYIRVPCVQ